MITYFYIVAVSLAVYGNGFEDENVYADLHSNVLISCSKNNVDTGVNVVWLHEGVHQFSNSVLWDGSLSITNVTIESNGIYSCIKGENDVILRRVRLIVKGSPSPPRDVFVSPSTVMVTVHWRLDPLPPEESSRSIHLQYKVKGDDKWTNPVEPIVSDQAQVDVFRLVPNVTYDFQLWTENAFGLSQAVRVTATTHHSDDMSNSLLLDVVDFNPHIWVVAVVVVLCAANVLGCSLLAAHTRLSQRQCQDEAEDPERIELVTHITENPVFRSIGLGSLDGDRSGEMSRSLEGMMETEKPLLVA